MMRGGQLIDSFKTGLRPAIVPPSENAAEKDLQVCAPGDERKLQQRLDFRSKAKEGVIHVVVERLHSEAIPCGKPFLGTGIINGEGPHPIEIVQAPIALGEERVQENFRI